jgi:hypothetical protein
MVDTRYLPHPARGNQLLAPIASYQWLNQLLLSSHSPCLYSKSHVSWGLHSYKQKLSEGIFD